MWHCEDLEGAVSTGLERVPFSEPGILGVNLQPRMKETELWTWDFSEP